ncbi:hypothetical protein E2C01_086529 [Portunus trituberculatus]|uniref:Uncharacterized protein n=1 Tax=Portunus trituberculatus TaxID=210409 RepID=A0A5B7J9J4_PORTR|nr:hypothetical protein [Portunus trituberculatus]
MLSVSFVCVCHLTITLSRYTLIPIQPSHFHLLFTCSPPLCTYDGDAADEHTALPQREAAAALHLAHGDPPSGHAGATPLALPQVSLEHRHTAAGARHYQATGPLAKEALKSFVKKWLPVIKHRKAPQVSQSSQTNAATKRSHATLSRGITESRVPEPRACAAAAPPPSPCVLRQSGSVAPLGFPGAVVRCAARQVSPGGHAGTCGPRHTVSHAWSAGHEG